MKRSVVVSVLLAVICLGCAGMKCPMPRRRHVMEKRGMWSCCPMHREMGMRMMKRTLVPTQDGGVALLMCNKLVKYDKDMNVLKEVELKSDTERMHKMMEEMCAGCPMCVRMSRKWRNSWKSKQYVHETEEHDE